MSEIEALSENGKLIEVILFIENTPLSIDRIMTLTSLGKDDVVDGLRELDEHYKARNSGTGSSFPPGNSQPPFWGP